MWVIIMASAFATAVPGVGVNACLDQLSSTLERSGEPARDVAEATVEACRVGTEGAKPGTIGAQLTPEHYRELQRNIREMARTQVVAKVVRIRACRKTPGCVPSDIALRDTREQT